MPSGRGALHGSPACRNLPNMKLLAVPNAASMVLCRLSVPTHHKWRAGAAGQAEELLAVSRT